MTHVIAVTVGVSIIDKTWKGSIVYEKLMGSDDGRTQGLLAGCAIDRIEAGDGWPARSGIKSQQDIERDCCQKIFQLPDIADEIRQGKGNRYSAEISSLYALLKDKELSEKHKYRIVLLATDSQEGILAARLNKRVIANRLFDCDKEKVLHWNNESNNHLDSVLLQIPIVRVSGLQVRDAARFEVEGNAALQQIIENIQNDPNINGKKILNITGGFKGVIPIAVGIAWYYGWTVVYLYEDTEGYLTIERPSFIRIEQPGNQRIIVGTQYRHL